MNVSILFLQILSYTKQPPPFCNYCWKNLAGNVSLKSTLLIRNPSSLLCNFVYISSNIKRRSPQPPRISNFLFIIRIFCKLFFFPLGKKKWHSFERKYLQYFMDNFYNFAPWKYIDILFDKRGHYSPISWYIGDYLERKKICWNGKKKLRNKNI